MKRADEILKLLNKNKEQLFKKYAVSSLGIFGSVSKGTSNPDSDIDIVVEFEKPIGIRFIDLAEELQQLLNQKVDLVSKKGIKEKYWDIVKQEIKYV